MGALLPIRILLLNYLERKVLHTVTQTANVTTTTQEGAMSATQTDILEPTRNPTGTGQGKKRHTVRG